MAAHNLSAVLKQHGNAVKLLRNSKIGMYVYPVVAAEFSNWRNEQVAWRKSAVLFDQTHHMDELIVEGPDSAAFLEYVGINSFANFDLNRAKHFVPVTPAGHVLGGGLLEIAALAANEAHALRQRLASPRPLSRDGRTPRP